MRGLWLIDGSYLYKASKDYIQRNPSVNGRQIDYLKLKHFIEKRINIDSMDGYYFNSTPNPTTAAQDAFHRWLRTSEPNGPQLRVKLYDIKKKNVRCTDCGKVFQIDVQKGVDVGIATTALRMGDRYEYIIVSSGDGDFEDFIRYFAEDKDKKVFFVGFNASISTDLQQYGDLISIDDVYENVCDTRGDTPQPTTDEAADI